MKLNQMLKNFEPRENTEGNSQEITASNNKAIAKTVEHSEDSLAELELKVRNYISTLDYKLMPNNYGFDICAKKTFLLGSDKYLAIDFNLDAEVTPTCVRDFLNKISKFNHKLNENVMWTPELRGLMAYTGVVPKNVARLTEGFKPIAAFKKF
jgi:hypothetical protein